MVLVAIGGELGHDLPRKYNRALAQSVLNVLLNFEIVRALLRIKSIIAEVYQSANLQFPEKVIDRLIAIALAPGQGQRSLVLLLPRSLLCLQTGRHRLVRTARGVRVVGSNGLVVVGSRLPLGYQRFQGFGVL